MSSSWRSTATGTANTGAASASCNTGSVSQTSSWRKHDKETMPMHAADYHYASSDTHIPKYSYSDYSPNINNDNLRRHNNSSPDSDSRSRIAAYCKFSNPNYKHSEMSPSKLNAAEHYDGRISRPTPQLYDSELEKSYRNNKSAIDSKYTTREHCSYVRDSEHTVNTNRGSDLAEIRYRPNQDMDERIYPGFHSSINSQVSHHQYHGDTSSVSSGGRGPAPFNSADGFQYVSGPFSENFGGSKLDNQSVMSRAQYNRAPGTDIVMKNQNFIDKIMTTSLPYNLSDAAQHFAHKLHQNTSSFPISQAFDRSKLKGNKSSYYGHNLSGNSMIHHRSEQQSFIRNNKNRNLDYSRYKTDKKNSSPPSSSATLGKVSSKMVDNNSKVVSEINSSKKSYLSTNTKATSATESNNSDNGKEKKSDELKAEYNKKEKYQEFYCDVCDFHGISERVYKNHCGGWFHINRLKDKYGEKLWMPDYSHVNVKLETDSGLYSENAPGGPKQLNNTLQQQTGSEVEANFQIDLDSDRSFCDVCEMNFQLKKDYLTHLKGLLHSQNVVAHKKKCEQDALSRNGKESKKFFCAICNKNCNSSKDFELHTLGATHRTKLLERDIAAPTKVKTSKIGEEEADKNETKNNGTENTKKNSMEEDLHCKICDCPINGSTALAAHIKGRRHLKNVRNNTLGAPLVKGRNSHCTGLNQPAVIEEKLAKVDYPLIGLQYVVEIHKEGSTVEPRYICELCNSKCDAITLVGHVAGVKHRSNYMREHYMTYHIMIKQAGGTKHERSLMVEEYADIVQIEEGRRKVRCKVDLDPFYTVRLPGPKKEILDSEYVAGTHVGDKRKQMWDADYKNKKICDEGNFSNYETDFSGTHPIQKVPMVYEDAYRQGDLPMHTARYEVEQYTRLTTTEDQSQTRHTAVSTPPVLSDTKLQTNSGSSTRTCTPEVPTAALKVSSGDIITKPDVAAMMNSLSTCLVNNEDEAAMALQVSNALTQALLKYRLQNVSQQQMKANGSDTA